jgi:hypothetical protein
MGYQQLNQWLEDGNIKQHKLERTSPVLRCASLSVNLVDTPKSLNIAFPEEDNKIFPALIS